MTPWKGGITCALFSSSRTHAEAPSAQSLADRCEPSSLSARASVSFAGKSSEGTDAIASATSPALPGYAERAEATAGS